MARRCAICGKGLQFGHSISHAHNLTNRKWRPNLHRVKAITYGAQKRIWICTRCLKAGKVEKAV